MMFAQILNNFETKNLTPVMRNVFCVFSIQYILFDYIPHSPRPFCFTKITFEILLPGVTLNIMSTLDSANFELNSKKKYLEILVVN